MKSIGLRVAFHKEGAREAAAQLARLLVERGVEVRARADAIEWIGEEVAAGDDEFVARSDLVIALGGDGTFLETARLVAPRQTPLLGVYLSGMGFLTETHMPILAEALDRVLSGDYEIEERMMLSASVIGEADEAPTIGGLLCLNDIVIRRDIPSHILESSVDVDGKFVANYRGDGVIIATPTGSTAYSLSAGGPVVHPDVDALLVTPLCAHTLNIRPLIIPPDSRVTLRVIEGHHPDHSVFLFADGRAGCPLTPQQTVTVSRAAFRARFVRLWPGTFYDRLRQKLHWGAEI